MNSNNNINSNNDPTTFNNINSSSYLNTNNKSFISKPVLIKSNNNLNEANLSNSENKRYQFDNLKQNLNQTNLNKNADFNNSPKVEINSNEDNINQKSKNNENDFGEILDIESIPEIDDNVNQENKIESHIKDTVIKQVKGEIKMNEIEIKDEQIKPVNSINKEKENINENDKKNENKISLNKEDPKNNISNNKNEENDQLKSKQNENNKNDNSPLNNTNNKNGASVSPPPVSSEILEKIKNEDQFKKLDKKTQTAMIKVIEDINKFDIDHPDLSNIDKYPVISKFDKNEKTLSELIPDFKKNILDLESRRDIKIRRICMNKKNYFEWKVQTNEEFLEYIYNCEMSHNDAMKEKYQREQLKNLPKVPDDFEKKIFDEKNLFDFNTAPIGSLENLETFLYKFNFYSNIKVFEKSYNTFNHWRRILADGNSFYRVFMFSLFESYILKNNINELKLLLSEITSDKFIQVYKKLKIDYDTCFILFSAILCFLEKNDISGAYELFLKCYLLKNSCFDKLLIIYLKKLIMLYVSEMTEIQRNYLAEQKKEPTKEMNLDLIDSMNIEPSFFIICLMTYLFNVNMFLYWVDGDLASPKDSIINFIGENNKDFPLIGFGYFFSSYYKLYSVDFDKNSFFEQMIKKDKPELKQLVFIIQNKKCKICNEDTEQIIFLEKKFIVCKPCLEKYITYVCNFRADSFKKDALIGLEYYSRPIQLSGDFYLDDFEYIELIEISNIINSIQKKFEGNVCSKCKETKNVTELDELNCGCLFCQKCLEELLLTITRGYKVLNVFEKKKLEGTKCICKKDFDLNGALDCYENVENRDFEECIERLKIYIGTICLICTQNVREIKRGKYVDIKNFKRLKIKKDKNLKLRKDNWEDFLDVDHVICTDCYVKNMKIAIGKEKEIDDEVEDENNENNEERSNVSDKSNTTTNNIIGKSIDKDKGTVMCNICCKKHFLDPKTFNNNACCAGGCYVC